MGYNKTVLHVSIIIVDYNSHRDTRECLISLDQIKTKGFKWNVIVIDNGSKEPLVLPPNLVNNNFELIRSSSNLGFTGGNNMGIYHSIEKYNSDYVVLLNNDTVVDTNFLQALFTCIETNPKYGIVGSKIYFYKGSEFHQNSYKKDQLGEVLWYAGGSIDWQHLSAFHRGVDEVDRGQFDRQKTSDFATGCSLMIRREVLEKVGTLDKRYFLYLEDVDLSMRARKAGYEIGFCPESKVWHKNAASSGGSGSTIHDYYQTRNRLLFAATHGDWQAWLAAVRLSWRDFFSGNEKKRQGVLHALTNQFGKQPVV